MVESTQVPGPLRRLLKKKKKKKASIKSEKITSAGKDVEKWGPLCSVDGVVKRENHYEKQYDH